jgi:hypothetical protein
MTPQQHWDAPPVHPQSGPQTYWDQPVSASPQSGPGWSPEPQSGSGWGAPAQPAFGEAGSHYQPRIPPTPPKQRKPLIQLVVAVVAAALLAGAGGYLLGSSTGGGDAEPDADPTPSAAAQGQFEVAQTAANKAKLDGELAGLAQPWLSSTMGSCVASGGKDAPPLNGDESRHVSCRYGSAWVHFVVYKTDAQRDAARNYRQQLNLNADEVAPGVHDPSRTTGGVTGAPGKVIEYAFRPANGRALCGMSWERDADTLATLMIEANCEEDLGGKWEPLRDLWQRHS